MMPKTKFGNCSSDNCNAENTECVKVGKNLFCISCRNEQKIKEQIARSALKESKRKSIATKPAEGFDSERIFLIEDLDHIASKYVRMKEADSDGKVCCYTCNWTGHWKECDCGHYISRSKMLLRWDIRNLRPQCKNCNQHLYGNIDIFTERLEKENPGITSELLEESRSVYKWTRQEMKELLIYLRSKVKIIEQKFNNEINYLQNKLT